MDNMDINLLNKMTIQNKTKKSQENPTKKRDRACSSMEYNEYFKNYGPPSPIFKPLNSPLDFVPEMQLPPSEMTDLIEEDYRKVLSCPTELKILVEEPNDLENDDFVMVEEDNTLEKTVSSSEVFQNNTTIPASQRSYNISSQLSSLSISKINTTPTPTAISSIISQNKPDIKLTKRQRSFSENVPNYSIYHFMENIKKNKFD